MWASRGEPNWGALRDSVEHALMCIEHVFYLSYCQLLVRAARWGAGGGGVQQNWMEQRRPSGRAMRMLAGRSGEGAQVDMDRELTVSVTNA